MSKELLARAERMRDHYRQLESRKGSGFHDEDKQVGIVGREHVLVAPQRTLDTKRAGKYLPRYSEHVVPFYDHDDREEVHFVGPDAERVLAALVAWKNKQRQPVHKMPGTERKLVLWIIPRLQLQTVEELPRLTVRLADWNDVLHALHEEGIGLSGEPLVADGTAPYLQS